MGITFKSLLSASTIKLRALEAVGRLRFSSPLIAAKILPGIHTQEFRSWLYNPAKDVSEVRDWARRTLRISSSSAVSGEDFVRKLAQVRLPYTDEDAVPDQHFYVHLLLGSGDLITTPQTNIHALFLHSTHALTDGVIGLALLRLLVETIAGGIQHNSTPIADLPWGKETENLAPGPVAAVGGVKDGWEEHGTKLVEARDKILGNPQPAHSLKPQRSQITEVGRAVRAHRVLEKELSMRIIQAVKAVGCTVTQLWDAAQAIATFEYNPELSGNPDPAKQHVTLFPAIVALHHLIQPPEKQRTAVGILDVGIPLVIPLDLIQNQQNPRDRLLAVMQSIKTQYATWISNPHLPVLEAAGTGLAPLKELFPEPNPYWGEITNIGMVERRLPTVWSGEDEGGRKSEAVVRVDGLFVGLRQMTMRTMTHVWTIHSKTHLQVQAADIWDQAFLEGFLDRMIAVTCAITGDE